jgi:RNA polymerase sigma-70 factor (ECF subfamily)
LFKAENYRQSESGSMGADCAVAECWQVPGATMSRSHLHDADAGDVRAVLAGDAVAFESLVRRHEKTVAAMMWRFSRDVRARHELIQDVFVEAYLALGSYDRSRPFLPWLRRIATRVGYRHWESLERQKRHVQVEEHAPARAADDGRAPAAERAAALLDAILARLAPEDRLVLTLMYFEGCDLREIAERTGWNRAAAAMRAHRARRRLKKIIERERLLEDLPWLK